MSSKESGTEQAESSQSSSLDPEEAFRRLDEIRAAQNGGKLPDPPTDENVKKMIDDANKEFQTAGMRPLSDEEVQANLKELDSLEGK